MKYALAHAERAERYTGCALLGAARFLESWPGVAAMWLALAAYCYL